jgi:hypothetical protein
MALEIAALLTAVGTINTLTKQTVEIVQTIRSGMMARNDDTKQKLDTVLKQIQENLKLTGKLAQAAEAYARTLEDVLELLSVCRRADDILKENLDSCRDRNHPNYASTWRVLDEIFRTIDTSRDTARKVISGRQEWYDQQDKIQIEDRLNQFTQAYTTAVADVRMRSADELVRDLRSMNGNLQDTELFLRSTVYDKILRALQDLGA